MSALSISVSTGVVSASVNGWLSTLMMAASVMSATATVALSGSTSSNAGLSYPNRLPAAWASAPAACSCETNMTPSIRLSANACRNSAALAWSLHVTPVDTKR